MNSKEFKLLDAPDFNKEKEKNIYMEEANHEYILQLFPAVPYTHEDAAALRVLYGALGDMSGIMFKEIRDKQALAYSTAPIAQFLPATGIFGFYVNSDPANHDKILPAFAKIVEDVQNEPLPIEMLDRAKKGIQTSYISSSQSLNSRVAEATNNAYLNRSYEFQQEFIDKSLVVTPEEVQEVAKKYLKPENAYLLRVMPSEK